MKSLFFKKFDSFSSNQHFRAQFLTSLSGILQHYSAGQMTAFCLILVKKHNALVEENPVNVRYYRKVRKPQKIF